MSLSHEMVAPDVRCISNIVRDFKATQVVETTNKRMVMWCPDQICAKNLAIRIDRNGYQYEIRKGLKSNSWYVQAFF